MNKQVENAYIQILEEELFIAMGCTEPASLAFGANKVRQLLHNKPTHICVKCSGNIIKNVKCVNIPNTQEKGIEAAVLYGYLVDTPKHLMEVFSTCQEGLHEQLVELLARGVVCVESLPSLSPLHFIIEMENEWEHALIEVKDTHTNIHRLQYNHQAIHIHEEKKQQACSIDRDILNVEQIYAFANAVDLIRVEALLTKLITYNLAIAKEGMLGSYGLDIGNTLLSFHTSPWQTAIAYTCAASEARMCGCPLPVVVNSGSGNQGISSSVPLIVYAQHKQIKKETLYRGLLLSSLLTIHQKTCIGRLSAFCGVISATCASGSGIAYMEDATLEQVKMVITNTLANVSGVICDGAKASCAAKISSGLQAAQLGYALAMKQKAYASGDGILRCDAEATISAIGCLAKEGMHATDQTIIELMLAKELHKV